ncbi:MAG: hypothetical protein R3253_12895, partial [Longimicrobiales bacterium]|nr:hypothetical protein [Longimicrobiales bacterium]
MVPMKHLAVVAAVTLAACGPSDEAPGDAPSSQPSMSAATVEHDNDIIALLDSGQPVFGMFAPEQSAEGGAQAAANTETDFIFYSLESGPWDIPTMEAFMAGMADASGDAAPHPVVLRIPPVRDDRAAARTHMEEGMAAGIAVLPLPLVETPEELALAVEVMGGRLWPLNSQGDVLTVILIEDQSGIE